MEQWDSGQRRVDSGTVDIGEWTARQWTEDSRKKNNGQWDDGHGQWYERQWDKEQYILYIVL